MKTIIANLTAEQRDRARRIIAHGDNEYSLMTLREPEPTGIGIPMSLATLYRLKAHLEMEDSISARDAIKSLADGVTRDEKDEPFTGASVSLLKERAFELSASNEPAHLNAASRILLNVQRLEAQRARQRIPAGPELTDQLQLEVAKLALLHFGEIGSIRGNKALSEDRKAQKIAERLFGDL
jgi:hypothetical protein